jgi:hypothetical protein
VIYQAALFLPGFYFDAGADLGYRITSNQKLLIYQVKYEYSSASFSLGIKKLPALSGVERTF